MSCGHDRTVPRVLLLLPTVDLPGHRLPPGRRPPRRRGGRRLRGTPGDGRRAWATGPSSCRWPISTLPSRRSSTLHARAPLDAVVAVDDQGVDVATAAAERLGLPHNPPTAVAATRDKAVMRDALAARRRAPAAVLGSSTTSSRSPTWRATSGYPCVVKPVGLSASRGVIRADDAGGVRARGRTRAATWPTARCSSRSTSPASRSRSKGCCATAAPRGPRDLRQARPARRPVLRGDDLRHAVAPPATTHGARRRPHLARGRAHSGSPTGRSTPSCASTAIASR